MSGKRNVSVCRGHELANALYMPAVLKSSLGAIVDFLGVARIETSEISKSHIFHAGL